MRLTISGLVAALLVLPSIAIGQPSSETSLRGKVDALVKDEMDRSHIPALSLAVVKDDHVVHAAGYGFADLGSKSPGQSETVYRIGSLSKQFIATGIMLLVEDEKIGLDDHVSKFFPDAPPTWADITVRRLLTHTAGLAREPAGYRPTAVQKDADLVRYSYVLPLRSPTGSEWFYSNLGYFVLAEIITRKTGEHWSKFIETRVFSPTGLRMTRTVTHSQGMANLAKGYRCGCEGWAETKNAIALRPSGAFVSTVLDLAKWDGVLRTTSLLTKSSRELMWTPVRLTNGKEYNYGFGWDLHRSNSGEVRSISHSGYEKPGFKSFMARFLHHKLAIAVLTNTDEATQLGSLVWAIAGLYLHNHENETVAEFSNHYDEEKIQE
jgi:D-alanyl-D-alanine carboxypeptidase